MTPVNPTTGSQGKKRSDSDHSTFLARLAFNALLVAVFVAAAWDALTFPSLARYFPLIVSTLGAIAALGQLTIELRRRRMAAAWAGAARSELVMDAPASEEPLGRTIDAAWRMLTLVPAIWLLGGVGGSVLYILLFLRFEGRWRWWTSLLAACATLLLMIVLEEYLNFYWPIGRIDLENLFRENVYRF